MTTRTGPSVNQGHSKQDYATPREFLAAVEKRWGAMNFDLAADRSNRVCEEYYGPGSALGEDSLAKSWEVLAGNLWLNPPFSDISPWAEKCSECVQRKGSLGTILLLVPASIGSNWFAKYVHPYAYVYALQGRLSFDGKAPYPKDCMLCVYERVQTKLYGKVESFLEPGFTVWDWRHSEKPETAQAAGASPAGRP